MPSAKGKLFDMIYQVTQSATHYFKEGCLLQWFMMGKHFKGYYGRCQLCHKHHKTMGP